VYKLSKALYGLKQAPGHGYVMGSVDKTLFTLNHEMTFYLFRFTWMISSLMTLLMCLCQVFRK
jgi:hypothetical protein